jgi:VanZ family protein
MPLLRTVVFPPRWMRALALAGFVLVAANLFWHGAQPYAVGAVPAPWDKLAHVVLYAGFSGAAWVVLAGRRRTADLLAPIAAIALGVLDEFAQSFSPGREVGLWDLAADATGAVAAAMLLASARHLLRRDERAHGARPARPGLSPR